MREASETHPGIAVAIGPVAAIVAAGICARFRDDAGSANVALVLAIIVVGAASAGRRAGAVTAVTAALSYNFFHTRPYNSLRIDRAHDVVTVLLLVAIGVGVSESNEWRRRVKRTSDRYERAERALERTTTLLARRADPGVVWAEVRIATMQLLRVSECRFEPGASASVPVMPRTGALVSTQMHMGAHGFRLPTRGSALAVEYDGTTLGHVVVSGEAGNGGSSIAERQAAIALADQYAIALGQAEARPPHPPVQVSRGSRRPAERSPGPLVPRPRGREPGIRRR